MYLGSRILVIGGTGSMGQQLARASLAAGHPTALLARPPATAAVDPNRQKLLEALEASGATIVMGDMNEHESLVAAIKQADVVSGGAKGGPLVVVAWYGCLPKVHIGIRASQRCR
ncbi:hypothetical protein ACP4OV_020786 [Aristida adscensionis]